ncbi:MAG: AAA family ATPase [Dorea sp.]|nr:AAA family ATPase [Dorea sp.]
MVYLSTFVVSEKRIKNPNIYPYNVFRTKEIYPLVFAPITIIYGNNGSGKSTLLNIIAQKINARGCETYAYGQGYIDKFVRECIFDTGEDDFGNALHIPKDSLYMKSEDILFEIKKIQQEDALERGYVYELMMQKGIDRESAEKSFDSHENSFWSKKDVLQFAQEKYSNGETAMQILIDAFVPDNLYLLDEPEVSLSPQNQVKLAEEINKLARFLGCQFIVATHSPFMLGTLQAKIYNLDSECMEEAKWYELENIRFFYEFFEKNRNLF